MPIKVGCKGFVGKLLHRALGVLGITGEVRSRAIKNITRAAEKSLEMALGRESMGTSKRHLNTSCSLINRGWVAWCGGI